MHLSFPTFVQVGTIHWTGGEDRWQSRSAPVLLGSGLAVACALWIISLMPARVLWASTVGYSRMI